MPFSPPDQMFCTLSACLKVHKPEFCNKYSLEISRHYKVGLQCRYLNYAGYKWLSQPLFFCEYGGRFFNISFLILRRWFSFWNTLYSLRVTLSSSDTLMGESCFTRLLRVLRFTRYSRLSCGYEIPPALYRSTICMQSSTQLTML